MRELLRLTEPRSEIGEDTPLALAGIGWHSLILKGFEDEDENENDKRGKRSGQDETGHSGGFFEERIGGIWWDDADAESKTLQNLPVVQERIISLNSDRCDHALLLPITSSVDLDNLGYEFVQVHFGVRIGGCDVAAAGLRHCRAP
jgi:hypothetical protein